MSVFDNIDDQKLDVLKELGNIGAGNAATSISLMLGKTIKITVPSAEIIPVSELWKKFTDPEEVTSGAMVEIEGEIEGALLFLLGAEETKSLIELLMLPRPDDLTNMDELTSSAIGEIANIMCSSYIIALSNFTGINIHSMPPKVVVDMLSAIVSEVSLIITNGGDYVILIQTDILLEELEDKVKGYLIYISDEKNTQKILESLGMKF
ncbi:MAG: CheY-P phosphatase CheC [Defluviitoga tunisiensis]|uniref:Chemotaxis protein CheY n=1 Tax=Defluviitoga tunisiensis TaxID=1006576 RepID=A0A0C7P3K5_DEFTU|nr:CheY-P phosphatase CheC [Defluviitoga tunisiensis]MDD3601552.1 CheY-P phosphatase CheC [Defluviitoga tunisiensis]MDY0380248.1 CheY-P phosphatase CheC [Defluviitoga tunisiensis]CEP78890.1 chemotaxis protein CheY [Defluviitoga tunisiensis]HHV01549.1 chemotaxis protein CheC [Defluviitoga tunisiensis]HOB55555.1 CheY-P phosphatase CheC [Defluviitoga tunisiensis]